MISFTSTLWGSNYPRKKDGKWYIPPSSFIQIQKSGQITNIQNIEEFRLFLDKNAMIWGPVFRGNKPKAANIIQQQVFILDIDNEDD